MKIAVILHLYYHDLWEEFSNELKKFGNKPFDLYVSLVDGSHAYEKQQMMQQKIVQEYPQALVFMVENKGLDIGSFLKVIGYFFRFGKEYDLILKLHSKKSIHTCGKLKGEDWRKELYQPLLENVSGLLNFMEKNHEIGMIGSKQHMSDFEGENRPAINYLENLLNIEAPHKIFVGGTMFWIRFSILKAYLTPKLIEEIADRLEEGYFTDYEMPRYTHAMERIFGYMISDNRKVIAGI